MGFFSSILIIATAYLLGSIPFGYLITRFSTGKNILKVGWRKTSGSNVFKNIGKWQGILTGIFDVSKGYLAVRLAQIFSFSPQIQVLCGMAAVTGHNWSIFLKFSGGRGIGTFIGAALLFSPKLLGLSLILPIVLSLIWNAAIGTILLLMILAILSFYPPLGIEVGNMGFFVLISLIPIFVKRLSPIEEIKRAQKKVVLIRNRLIFDNDQICLDLRIKRILQRLTKC